jgi:membrane protein
MSRHELWGLLRRTWQEYNEDQVAAVAGGATFFGLLALFPALGVFVSLYGLIADVEEARLHILRLDGFLPEGAVAVLGEHIARLAATPDASLGVAFAVSLLLSIWSSNAGVKSLIGGLNIAYDTPERRGFLRLNALCLGFTLAGVCFAILAGFVAGWLDRSGFGSVPLVALLQWPVLLILVVTALSVLYRYGPSRPPGRWRWITPGSAFVAVAWVCMSMAFTIYVANFGSYDKTYGSLGAVVGFMTWIWLSLTLVLIGAELDAELDKLAAAPDSGVP